MPNMFSSVFSFLTIIPSGSHTLEDTAKNMHAFPAIGLLMGFVLGMAALGLYYAGVDQIIAAFLLVAATMLITVLTASYRWTSRFCRWTDAAWHCI